MFHAQGDCGQEPLKTLDSRQVGTKPVVDPTEGLEATDPGSSVHSTFRMRTALATF